HPRLFVRRAAIAFAVRPFGNPSVGAPAPRLVPHATRTCDPTVFASTGLGIVSAHTGRSSLSQQVPFPPLTDECADRSWKRPPVQPLAAGVLRSIAIDEHLTETANRPPELAALLDQVAHSRPLEPQPDQPATRSDLAPLP